MCCKALRKLFLTIRTNLCQVKNNFQLPENEKRDAKNDFQNAENNFQPPENRKGEAQNDFQPPQNDLRHAQNRKGEAFGVYCFKIMFKIGYSDFTR